MIDRVAIFDGPAWWGSAMLSRSGALVTPKTAAARLEEADAEHRALTDLIAGFRQPGCLIVSTGERGAPEGALLAAAAAGHPTLALARIDPDDAADVVSAAARGLGDTLGARSRVYLCGLSDDAEARARWQTHGLRVQIVPPWQPPPEPEPQEEAAEGS